MYISYRNLDQGGLLNKIALIVCFLTFNFLETFGGASIDPIRFTMTTHSSQIELNEEIEIEITARYLSVSPTVAFVFEGSNSFKLKLITPSGFKQTGGDFVDLIGGELSPSRPFIKYTFTGKFTHESGDGIFQLLRSHKNANSQSDFIQVAKLSFSMHNYASSGEIEGNARILAQQTLGTIPYLTIEELRSGLANDASTVFITNEGREGLFKHHPESTAPDDGGVTLIAQSMRYVRVYEGAVNVTWFGVIGDGITDNSSAIQTILNNTNFSLIYFPKPQVSYRLRTVQMRSNKNIIFEEGTVVEGMGTLDESQKMVLMYQVENITIKGNNVIFKDRRANYTSGQHKHIFSLEGVTNVVIDGIAANNSGGDGFYIGTGVQKRYSENVKLLNISADNNRRQGVSIISGRNILINNAVLSNTNGARPSAGIDIEPNAPDEILEGIVINNVTTKNNQGAGIVITLNTLSNTDRIVDIIINNHIDDGSYYGFAMDKVTGKIDGRIVIDKALWKNSIWNGFNATNYGSESCVVELRSPTVINANTRGNTSLYLASAFLIYRPVGSTGASNIGNIHIINPVIQDTRSVKLITSAFIFHDLTQVGPVLNCSLIDPKLITGLDESKYLGIYGDLALSDLYNKISKDIGEWHYNLTYSTYKRVIHNQSATTHRNLTLAKVIPEFPEVRVEVRTAQTIRIMPAASDNILPLSAIPGKYISSNTVGSSVVLKKTSNDSWHIKEITGTWTVE
jgi:hypothetical protein